ncbi:GyrI-like domain-containing protein [Urechidicola croceus]|uniref:Transcriptional regulator n=1 Tax=Urechidicola croceus TaxID=1850246 RepID=A0A1D8PAE1_9FLAO|nr:GyrI-like domain-containing protein [Urechidicola croceus]AOW21543.1 transcriptional regulator [Urechidicola croceus]
MRKVLIAIFLLIIGFLVWYIFIKPNDYIVTLKAKTNPGTINQSIKLWSDNIGNSSIQQDDLYNLNQKIQFGDSIYNYNWNIKKTSDSTSKITVGIKDLNHSIMNKLSIPFGTTDFEKRTKNTLTDFSKKLNEHIENFKITIEGKSEIKSTFCAYVPMKGKQIEKARGMMKNYEMISSFIVQNNVELNGKPIIEITKWNQDTDSIHFNFCYPIIKPDTLPNHTIIKYKQLESKHALKAIYNGNYITSDRTWYALQDYAKKNNFIIENTPFEIFQNNPNLGGNELKWVTEVYLPIKK